MSIVLASPSSELGRRIESATTGQVILLPGDTLPTDPAHLFNRLDGHPAPTVVLLDCDPSPEAALNLAGSFEDQCPAISVILVSADGPELGLAALRAGVHDILGPDTDISEIRAVLNRADQVARSLSAGSGSQRGDAAVEADEQSGGRVISVVAPKGGVGRTTVATNLAAGLALAAPQSTVLVDLDLQFGDVASAFNLEPEYSLAAAVHGPASQDTMVLKTFLTQHDTGLFVLCAPPSPVEAETITGQQVAQLLQMLASEFRYVVVDTAPGLTEHTLAALDHTTDLVLLTSMDVPGVRGLRKEMDTLAELQMSTDTRHVLLNFADRRNALTIADIEATLGASVDLRLPRSKSVAASVDQGVPLLQSGVRDPMAKQLRTLINTFAPTGSVSRSSRRAQAYQEVATVRPRRAAPLWRRRQRVATS